MTLRDVPPPRLDDSTLWASMYKLIDRLFCAIEGDDVIALGLDVLVELLGADRGLVLLTYRDGTTHAVSARGQKRPLDAIEQQEISRTIVQESITQGRCVVWDPGTGDDGSASMIDLGIATALAAPLFATSARRDAVTSRAVRGALYVDFRSPLRRIGPEHVEFFTAAAQLLGAAFDQHHRVQETREDLREARAQAAHTAPIPSLDELLAPPSMAAIRAEVESCLRGTSSILILGESGTGKTLLAQAIAEASGRRPIVRAVLGASDDLNTITSELFGHERGAYSGAFAKRVGLVEFARGGTLIFDEILNLPPHAQQLLLDFTQFGSYRPLGYDKPDPKRAELRIIAATNGDLDAAIREGRFRQDLFYRLAAASLHLPPLRARRQDIAALAESHLRRTDRTRPWQLSIALRRALVAKDLSWPGNIRQLERLIERARERALTRDENATIIAPEHLDPRDLERATANPQALPDPRQGAPEAAQVTWKHVQEERARIEAMEQQVIENTLGEHDGVVAHTARALGIARSTLISKMEVLGITRAASRGRAGDS